jgi:hypothetical protein
MIMEFRVFRDPNGDVLSKIRISTLPLNGQLKLNGIALLANQEILSADISKLSYIPDADFNGSDSFKWNAADSGRLICHNRCGCKYCGQPGRGHSFFG